MDLLVILSGSLGALVIAEVIAGLIWIGAIKVRVNNLESDLKDSKKLFTYEINKFKVEYRTWKERHEENSSNIPVDIGRLETKIDDLIDRINRSGINGKH